MQLKAYNLQYYYYPVCFCADKQLHHMCKEFKKVDFSLVDRSMNGVADKLANKGVKKYKELSLEEKAELTRVNQEYRKSLLEPTQGDEKIEEMLAREQKLRETLGEISPGAKEDILTKH